jgi:hypothetical protein
MADIGQYIIDEGKTGSITFTDASEFLKEFLEQYGWYLKLELQRSGSA